MKFPHGVALHRAEVCSAGDVKNDRGRYDLCYAAILLSCLLMAGSASAEGWTIKDLGGTPTEKACVDLALNVYDRYRTARSVGDLQRSDGWSVDMA